MSQFDENYQNLLFKNIEVFVDNNSSMKNLDPLSNRMNEGEIDDVNQTFEIMD